MSVLFAHVLGNARHQIDLVKLADNETEAGQIIRHWNYRHHTPVFCDNIL